MVVVAAAVVAAGLPTLVTLVRRPRGDAVVRSVHEAVLRYRPEMVLYSNGGPDDLHWVTSWLDTLDALGARGRPGVVMLRHPPVLDLLPPATTPLVCLPDARDILPFTLPDARVALYVANSPENTRLLRSTQLRSALVGHGESDKASSASPLAKMYDQVWVAGETAVARYLEADVGVRAEQLRIVGRPQVRRVARAAPREAGAPWSVLYAPTWEGIFGESSAESSLLRSGVAVVRGLLSLDGVRVLYRPHPNTGRRDPRYVRAHEQILALLAAAGAPHAVVQAPATDVYEALNLADVLIADVSAVVVDFLASGKPYLVVNDTDLSESQFRERFPSTAGARILGRGAEGLAAALADARGPDSMRAAREQVRRQLVGPPTDDPIGMFAAAIDALGDTLRPRGEAGGAARPPSVEPRAAS
jgi:CDP-Glycerol:Poly(glycerophosphate) glycerophosphotransferase